MKPPAESIRYHGRHLLTALAGRLGARLPGPLGAQVQTVDRCNGHCRMCPYGRHDGGGAARYMAPALYTSLLQQLRASGGLLWFSPTLQNEPLLDPHLEERVREARTVLGPRVRLVIVTNGSLLTPERARALRAAGTDRFDISLDALGGEVYRRVRPGLPYDTVRHHTETLLAMPDRGEVRVRFVRQRENAAEEEAFRRHWQARGARVTATARENRRGAVDAGGAPGAGRRRAGALRRLAPACLHPFAHLCVLADGRVLPCCQDWTTDHLAGDLSRQSLAETWHGSALRACRAPLAAWRFRESPLCRRCTLVTRIDPARARA